jgi:hypothetical protein
MFASMYLGYQVAYGEIEQSVGDQQIQAARAIARNASLWKRSRLREVTSWAEHDIYAKAMEDSLLGKSARKAAQTRLARLLTDYPMYEAILLADRAGEPVALAAGDKGVYPLDLKADPAFAEAVAGHVATPRQVRVSPLSGRPTLVFFLPVGKDTGGVLVAALDLTAFGQDFLEPLGRTGSTEAFLVDQGGLVVLHSNADRALKLRIGEMGLGTEIGRAHV